jgi:hypothetical protein
MGICQGNIKNLNRNLKRNELLRRTRRLRWTGQSRAAFEKQYLTGSFYLYHGFSVIVAQPLSFMG